MVVGYLHIMNMQMILHLSRLHDFQTRQIKSLAYGVFAAIIRWRAVDIACTRADKSINRRNNIEELTASNPTWQLGCIQLLVPLTPIKSQNVCGAFYDIGIGQCVAYQSVSRSLRRANAESEGCLRVRERLRRTE